MKNILGNAIKDLRKSKKLTQKQLSELTGYKQNTISNHENGNRQLDENDIRVYAKALDVSPQTLFDKTNPRPSTSIPLPNFDPRKTILLSNYDKLNDTRKNKLLTTSETLLAEEQGKVIDISEKRAEYDARKRISLSVPGKVSAGTGYWQEDDYDTMVDFYADDIPDESKYDTVAVVVGHSMEPKIKNGDFLFIKLKDQVDLNKIGIFQVDGENYVKKLKSDYLESLNPDYDNIPITADTDFRTIGEVVEVYRER
ncbi:helix-turn-helix transcriptional regulator [Streptococcus suis]|uniref:helix-turn-helix domain-containing protein n=1 Tax=Streptococcus suis TaxID=1307 RepID=UPI001556C15E|nr:XRE family transcriptional regulator [Streptococcus suis]MBM6381710.1 helix-turn-helix transcriptional regulator [Streptococcus suis]MBM6391451.1 helix-turn-helix transcriptional regulator [Streptococcus suis]MBM6393466.1 helix-turn-helix transcriptional regulator [Streptococcus suis]MBM6449368.1 helix-turn-helix transcriptional regulator [Streptococcus suis]MBM6460071.1 helix-turn-helix transcriptional regulator [Streptococcus suis]